MNFKTSKYLSISKTQVFRAKKCGMTISSFHTFGFSKPGFFQERPYPDKEKVKSRFFFISRTRKQKTRVL
jgi:hypothetical protein